MEVPSASDKVAAPRSSAAAAGEPKDDPPPGPRSGRSGEPAEIPQRAAPSAAMPPRSLVRPAAVVYQPRPGTGTPRLRMLRDPWDPVQQELQQVLIPSWATSKPVPPSPYWHFWPHGITGAVMSPADNARLLAMVKSQRAAQQATVQPASGARTPEPAVSEAEGESLSSPESPIVLTPGTPESLVAAFSYDSGASEGESGSDPLMVVEWGEEPPAERPAWIPGAGVQFPGRPRSSPEAVIMPPGVPYPPPGVRVAARPTAPPSCPPAVSQHLSPSAVATSGSAPAVLPPRESLPPCGETADLKAKKKATERVAREWLAGPDAEILAEEYTRGRVLRFDNGKGYGFLQEYSTGHRVFVNRMSVKRDDLPQRLHNLREEEVVDFIKVSGPKGWYAVAVRRISTLNQREAWREESNWEKEANRLRQEVKKKKAAQAAEAPSKVLPAAAGSQLQGSHNTVAVIMLPGSTPPSAAQ